MQVTSLLQLKKFSKKLLSHIRTNSIVGLRGELGVGKTQLVSYLLQNLVGANKTFNSPTFNIVHEYYSEKKQCKIYHLDLYRIRHVDELHEIGFSSILNDGIVLVEWPEISHSILQTIEAKRVIMIDLSFAKNNVRTVLVSGTCNIV
jgi:tRNA threonylcarbamoyladenosine biosynthesis protein TsaE